MAQEHRKNQKESHKKGWFREITKPLRGMRREVFIASFFINLFGFATPVFVLQVYDRVIAQAGMTTLQGLVIGMLLIIVFDFILRQARSGLLQEAAMNVDARVAGALFDKVLSLPLRTLEKRPSAFWQACFRDVDQIRTMISGATAVMIADLPFALIGCLLVVFIATPVSWVLLIYIPLYILLAWRASVASRSGESEERKSTIRRDALISEIVAGRSTAKALGIRRYMRDIWETRQVGAIDSAIRRAKKSDRYHSLGHSLNVLATVTLVSAGVIAILDQTMTIGSLIAANMLLGRIIQPLHQLIHQWRNFTAYKQSIKRLDQVFNMTEDLQEPELELDRPEGLFHVDGVIFRYDGEDSNNAIQGIRASFGPGGMHALVGGNGCGKSTFVQLLRGLYKPMAGRIMLDSADLSQFSEKELISWIGYLPQECRLFNGTVLENLKFGFPDAKDKDIIHAAKLAGVHKQILDLPKGFAAQVGEGGTLLSGGLRQKITIARALLGSRPVLILDEPTSNLDLASEKHLAATLQEVSKTTTIIIVTHSNIMLEACDNILLMEQGSITAGGPTAQMLPKLLAGSATTPVPLREGT